MKAVLVFADGRTASRDDCDGSQWWEMRDTFNGTTRNRYFKACEVAHTNVNGETQPIGEHVLVYAEQPWREYVEVRRQG